MKRDFRSEEGYSTSYARFNFIWFDINNHGIGLWKSFKPKISALYTGAASWFICHRYDVSTCICLDVTVSKND